MLKSIKTFILSVMKEARYRKSIRNLALKNIPAFQKGEQPRFVFFGSPEYNNLGDQAIALSITNFLHVNFPNIDMIEIPESKILNNFDDVITSLYSTDIICLTGGGNFGNEYNDQRIIRNIAIKRFTMNPIIVFPQSVFYTQNIIGKCALNNDRKIIRRNKKVYIFARDEISFKFLQSKLQVGNVFCTPDIVLSMADYINMPNNAREEVLFCLRNDAESKLSIDDKNFLKAHFVTYSEIDTCLPYDISIPQRKTEIDRFIEKLSRAKLVITDRLHGAIFCAITQTPCVVFNNYNHKIKGIVKWLNNCSNIFFCESISEFNKALTGYSSNNTLCGTITWESFFLPLKTLLLKILDDVEKS